MMYFQIFRLLTGLSKGPNSLGFCPHGHCSITVKLHKWIEIRIFAQILSTEYGLEVQFGGGQPRSHSCGAVG